MRLNSPRELATSTSSEDEEIPQRGGKLPLDDELTFVFP